MRRWSFRCPGRLPRRAPSPPESRAQVPAARPGPQVLLAPGPCALLPCSPLSPPAPCRTQSPKTSGGNGHRTAGGKCRPNPGGNGRRSSAPQIGSAYRHCRRLAIARRHWKDAQSSVLCRPPVGGGLHPPPLRCGPPLGGGSEGRVCEKSVKWVAGRNCLSPGVPYLTWLAPGGLATAAFRPPGFRRPVLDSG